MIKKKRQKIINFPKEYMIIGMLMKLEKQTREPLLKI